MPDVRNRGSCGGGRNEGRNYKDLSVLSAQHFCKSKPVLEMSITFSKFKLSEKKKKAHERK